MDLEGLNLIEVWQGIKFAPQNLVISQFCKESKPSAVDGPRVGKTSETEF